MNNFESYYSKQSYKPTAEDILAAVSRRREQETAHPAGTTSVLNEWVPGANTAHHPAPGATLLNNKNEIKSLKAVAPAALVATAPSGVVCNTSGAKGFAAPLGDQHLNGRAASLAAAEDKTVVVPLRSPDDSEDAKLRGAGEEDGRPGSVRENDIACGSETSEDELFDPEFYRIRVDLFDNGAVKNRNRFTAKLSVTRHQDDDPAKDLECYANFYSRARDFKSFIDRNEAWDDWYDNVYERYQAVRDSGSEFTIKPALAILKEKQLVDHRIEIDPVLHTACILYQLPGGVPELAIFYSGWSHIMMLDAKFNRHMAKAPTARGYYVDPARAHLVVAKERKGFKRPSKGK